MSVGGDTQRTKPSSTLTPSFRRAKDVQCEFHTQSLRLVVKGDVVVEGETYKEVDVEECTWQIDRGSGDGGGRRDGSGSGENGEEVSNGDQNQDADKDDEGKTKIWVTLKKKESTESNSHWASVVRGDRAIDPQKFGPQIVHVDPDDPASMKAAMAKQAKSRR